MFVQSPQNPIKLERGHTSIAGMSAIGCRNDFTLEIFVSGCRGDFDFTILFEHLILSVVPSVCILLLSPYRIWGLHSRPVVIRETESTMMKIIQHVFVDYTVVAVTHSLESIASFDRVIVMGNGQVIQEGIPDFFSKEHASVTN